MTTVRPQRAVQKEVLVIKRIFSIFVANNRRIVLGIFVHAHVVFRFCIALL